MGLSLGKHKIAALAVVAVVVLLALITSYRFLHRPSQEEEIPPSMIYFPAPDNLQLSLDKSVYEEYDTVEISVKNISENTAYFPGIFSDDVSFLRWVENDQVWEFYTACSLGVNHLDPTVSAGVLYKLGLEDRSFPPGLYRVRCYFASADFSVVPRSSFIGIITLDKGKGTYVLGEEMTATIENPSGYTLKFMGNRYGMELKRWSDENQDWEPFWPSTNPPPWTVFEADNIVTIKIENTTLNPGEDAVVTFDLNDNFLPGKYIVVSSGWRSSGSNIDGWGTYGVIARAQFEIVAP
jgi:hypothetical protein